MDMLGPLTNHLWQTTWFAVAVWLLTLEFGGKCRMILLLHVFLSCSIGFCCSFPSRWGSSFLRLSPIPLFSFVPAWPSFRSPAGWDAPPNNWRIAPAKALADC